ncbi:hypothetical protein LAZ67_7001535 [Cordylochernes scorpioides]|uniref:Uncharacterized protein n=1 Tax=Cordylochernes scorpioides TaxID=51811 RepID=A0ABY6KMD9_9ARAC|nr:hypothetical protein LAZ67_7001535 [Cordylochernes scorpioides]
MYFLEDSRRFYELLSPVLILLSLTVLQLKLAAETSGQRSKLWIFHKEETIPVQHRRRQKVLEEGTQESEMLLT